jgi:hypothetical protein
VNVEECGTNSYHCVFKAVKIKLLGFLPGKGPPVPTGQDRYEADAKRKGAFVLDVKLTPLPFYLYPT